MVTSAKDSVTGFLDKFRQFNSQGNLHLVVLTGYASHYGLALLEVYGDQFDSITVIIGEPKDRDLRPRDSNYQNANAIAFVQRRNVHVLTHRNRFVHIKSYIVLEGSIPLGVLSGSANLTYSGLVSNLESMNETHPDTWTNSVEQYNEITQQCVDIKEQVLDVLDDGESSFEQTQYSEANRASYDAGTTGWETALSVAGVAFYMLLRVFLWILWVPPKILILASRKCYAQVQYIYDFWKPSWIHPRFRAGITFLVEIAFWIAIFGIVSTAITAFIIHLSTLADVFTSVGRTTLAVIGTVVGIAIVLAFLALIGGLYTSLGAVGGTVALVTLIIVIAIVANRCGISL